MGRLRFVQPSIVRLPLTEGDWIEIKHELTAGEEREVFARMTKSLEAGQRPQLDASQVQIATVLAYLVGWSFVDAAGRPVDVTEAAVKQLDTDSFKEVHAAIAAHEAAVAVKKTVSRAGANASSPTSGSPVA